LDITVSLEVTGFTVSGQSDANDVTVFFKGLTKGSIVHVEAEVTAENSIRFGAEGLGALSSIVMRLGTTGRGIINTKLTTHVFGLMVFLGLFLGFGISKVNITVSMKLKKKKFFLCK
jgi:hypothetical protein